EGSITELAAERADDADVARIEAANRQFAAARSSKDRLLLLQTNREFHFAIYAAGRHPTLMGLIEPLWARSGPCTLALVEELTQEQIGEGASPLHHDALEAIKARKPAQARKAIVADILATSTRYQLSWIRGHTDAESSQQPAPVAKKRGRKAF